MLKNGHQDLSIDETEPSNSKFIILIFKRDFNDMLFIHAIYCSYPFKISFGQWSDKNLMDYVVKIVDEKQRNLMDYVVKKSEKNLKL